MTRFARWTLVIVFVTIAPSVARAQDTPPGPAPAPAPAPRSSALTRTALFLAGGVTGLGIHESGHMMFGKLFDADPRVKKITYGPIRFFAIDHNPVSRRKEFVISSAGFWMQQASAEWILAAKPDLRHEDASFVDGVFAFHLGTSVVYGVAAFLRAGPPERDTRGMAISLGKRGVAEPLIGALVLVPALLDGYRYVHPDAAWARWTSRGMKVFGVGLTITAGR